MIGDGDDDLAPFLADFGQDVTFVIDPDDTPGSDLTIKGVFTERTEGVMLAGFPIEAEGPRLDALTSQVTTVLNGMTVTISGDSYEIKKKQDLGTGITSFILKTQ